MKASRTIPISVWYLLSAARLAQSAPLSLGTSLDREQGDLLVASPVAKAISGIALDQGVITITGNGGVDTVVVSTPYRGGISVSRNGFTQTFSTTGITKIVFYGNAGDDSFANGTSVPCEVYGGDGNDTLSGSGGDDFIVGGYGQDVIRGYGGNDVLWGSGGSDDIYGGEGDDILKGHGGADHLYGGNGEDALYGGSGADWLSGGNDADTLVAIGGGIDTIVGDAGNDFFWVDSDDQLSDVSIAEGFGGWVNQVSSYYAYSYNGGTLTTPVAKDLTNYDLPDPLPEMTGVHLENFADRPLFRAGGPHKEDVLQGSVGDCFILGPLSAVADATPDSIRKLVVDLDDGTYVVRQFRTEGGTPEYVRVDADLWTNSMNQPVYAKLGLGEQALWVPIVEKAFAFFRNKTGSYAAIDGGNSGTGGSVVMGADTDTRYDIPDVYDAAAIVAWHNSGRPAGAIKNYINASVPVLLNWIHDRQQEGLPVYTGNWPGSNDATPIVEDYWRRGKHIIMIDHVDFNANSQPISITLRDQAGNHYRTLTDFARIYFFLGRAVVYDMP